MFPGGSESLADKRLSTVRQQLGTTSHLTSRKKSVCALDRTKGIRLVEGGMASGTSLQTMWTRVNHFNFSMSWFPTCKMRFIIVSTVKLLC